MTALVTGASSGIGETYARALAAIGYDVILVARRKKRLEALAQDLRMTFSTEPEVFPADLCDEADLKRVEERIASAGPLEFLINNAGFGVKGGFLDTDADAHEAMHKLHVKAMLRLTHAALRVMVPRRVGAIVNVSSVAAFAPAPGSVSYSATKAWANTFTHALSLELRAKRSPVRVQALCPGFTYTEFHDVMGLDRGLIPRGWWLTPEDVVAESFKGLAHNRLFVIPGGRYRALVAALRFMPRKLYDAGTLEYARRTRRMPEAQMEPAIE